MTEIGRRAKCDVCDKPLRTCMCPIVRAHSLPSCKIPLKIVILQHPNERNEWKSTVSLLRLLIPSRDDGHSSRLSLSVICAKTLTKSNFSDWEILSAPGTFVVFPGVHFVLGWSNCEGSSSQRIEELLDIKNVAECLSVTGQFPQEEQAECPIRALVFLDGTWRTCRRMYAKNSVLHPLPMLALHPPFCSRYRIRREPTETSLSTLEAVAYATALVQRDARVWRVLVSAMDCLIDSHLSFIRHEVQ